MRSMDRLFVPLLAVAALAFPAAPARAASPPTNDEVGAAIPVTALPFDYRQDTTQATAGGPRRCGNNASVFFRFEPTEGGRYQVDTFGSGYDTVLTVYREDQGPVDVIRCNDDLFGLDAGLRFRGLPGAAYTIMVTSCCGTGADRTGGALVLHVDRVNAVPLSASIEITGGTTDPLSGDLTVKGTVECSERSIVYLEASIRQVRDGTFIARVYLSGGLACDVNGPHTWSVIAEPQTGVAFASGRAAVRYISEGATDGFRESIQLPVGEDTIVTIS